MSDASAETKWRQTVARWRYSPLAFVREALGAEPDAWQADFLQALATHTRLAMVACKGPGKLQRTDDFIDTPQGRRRFGDLRPGDLVFTADGSPTLVTAIHPQGVKRMCRVVFDDGSSLHVGREHLWTVRGRTERRHGTWSTLSTEDIIKRGVREPNGRWQTRQFEIPRHGPAQYPAAAQPVAPYLMGVWLGDGTKGQPAFTCADPDIADAVVQCGYVLTPKPKAGTAAFTYRVRDSAASFRAVDGTDLGSPYRYISDIYKHASVEQRLALLRGLMDTDGCIGSHDNHVEYGTTSKRLADDVVWLVRSLGGVALIKAGVKRGWYRDDEGNKVACRDCYRVTIVTPFCPFHLPRKAERWSPPQERYLTRYIDRIEEAGEAEAMCITVAHESGLYLADDFIVTHNSTADAWAVWWWLVTRKHPKVVCTSITEDNLRDGLWSELAKWRHQARTSILREMFTWTAERIWYNDYKETWWCSARPFSKQADPARQADTLAGVHADAMMFVIDEAGSIPVSVMVAAEAGLANVNKEAGREARLILSGNPTETDGSLYKAAMALGADGQPVFWVKNITADPDASDRTPRITPEYAREMIHLYGPDNPWILVNIFGRFPPSSSTTFINREEAEAAAKRIVREDADAPRVLGVDVARYGDDEAILQPRQGRVAFKPEVFRNLSTTALAAEVIKMMRRFKPDAVFVDGGGVGGGVVDRLHELGFRVTEVNSSSTSSNPERYLNLRAEMWSNMKAWLLTGAIPNDRTLVAQLSSPKYGHTKTKQQLVLESKDDMKKRGLQSPDRADALALTFAYPVASRGMLDAQEALADDGPSYAVMDFNPMMRRSA